MKFIPYGRQEILQEDIEAVVETLKSDFLTQGPAVKKFEEKLAKFLGGNSCVFAVNNGTSALHLAVLALNLKPGEKVLVTTNSFVASANCVEYCGGIVEFVDIDSESLNIDYGQIELKLKNSKPKEYAGIIAVDFAGYPLDFLKLRKFADEYGLWLIEDACHAIGGYQILENESRINCGSAEIADISVLSFHPVKHLAMGEGGAVVTRSKHLASRIELLRTHGITKDFSKMKKNDGPWYYEMQELGHNFRIPDILCSLGLSQLNRLESNLNRRVEIAKRYINSFEKYGILTLNSKSTVGHAYHLFIIKTNFRNELVTFLKERNIGSQVHYIPIHTQPYYVQKYGKQTLAASEENYNKILSLPMFHSMTDEDTSRVLEAVSEFMEIKIGK